MFRTIALVQCNDHGEAQRIVDAALETCAADANVRNLEVAVGLRLLDHPLAPQASYSIIMDFDDEVSWHRYRAGSAHDRFQALSAPHAQAVLTTQYARETPS
jgi:hypothetical protein